MRNKRLTRTENKQKIEEKEQIFVPGTKFFDRDYLSSWIASILNPEINLSLLFHKFPVWFKNTNLAGSPNASNKLTGISLSHDFEIFKKTKWSKEPHDYKKEHLQNIAVLSSLKPPNYKELKARYFYNNTYSFMLETKTRLLVGFAGTGAVFGNSISLHHLYGFPIIPGSSLKGLCRSYCKSQEVNADKMERMFGRESQVDGGKEGEVVFMDAWPDEWSKEPLLELDIMTPHYSEYYGGKKYPSDKDSPVPIIFLAVRPRVKFRFTLMPDRTCKNKNIVDETKKYLTSSLIEFGVGAKTGSSYGYFKEIG